MKREQLLSRGWGVSTLFITLSILGALAGCAKDRTTDEYHDQKAQQNIAVDQLISASETARPGSFQGSYQGNLTSSKDGSSLGTIQIEFWPEITPISSSDNTGTASEVVIRGRVTLIHGADTSQATILSATYFSPDYSTNGNFTGQIGADFGTGTISPYLTISGNLSGDTFNGLISTINVAGISGTFQAKKTALQNLVPNALIAKADGSATPRKNTSQSYSGKFQIMGQSAQTTASTDNTVTANLTIRNTSTTVDQDFVNTFALQQSRNITLTFGGEGSMVVNSIVFPNAVVDYQNGIIKAKTAFAGQAGTSTISLDCNLVQVTTRATGWSCTYSSTLNQNSFNFVVSPQ